MYFLFFLTLNSITTHPSFPPLAEVLNETLGSGSGVVAGGIFSANGLSSIFMHGDFVSFTYNVKKVELIFW